MEIRESGPGDAQSLDGLYTAAFPDEDLRSLVRELLAETAGFLSLVAVADGAVAGHVAFTQCGVGQRIETVALLGPLAVAPAQQRRGIGRALVAAGLNRLRESGTRSVLVLGDPAYYSRLGFAPETRITPPYDLPDEWQDAWQSIDLGHFETEVEGRLTVPSVWRKAELWGP